jgi:hypothetical protein
MNVPLFINKRQILFLTNLTQYPNLIVFSKCYSQWNLEWILIGFILPSYKYAVSKLKE